MLGLKRGTVKIEPHCLYWEDNAKENIALLKNILGTVAVDIQHIGSTAIKSIHAKPIIDIVVGVRDLNDIILFTETLKESGFIFRGSDQAEQLLFVKGDFVNDTRTHHIHIVKWNGKQWNNYINFRDYLNFNKDMADEYDSLKIKLQKEYPNDRNAYTSGKQKLIDKILSEAQVWRNMKSEEKCFT